MHFVIGSGLIIFLISLMVVSPGFRNVVLVLLGLVVVGIFLLIQNENKRSEESRAQQARKQQIEAADEIRRLSAIPVGQLEIINPRLGRQGTYWQFSGVVKHNSDKPLDYFDAELQVRECEKTPCVIIGQQNARMKSIVPPGQARQFTETVIFRDMPSAKVLDWSYKVYRTHSSD